MLEPFPLGSFAADHSARAAADAGNKAEQADRHFREVQLRLDQLTLLTEAMWSLIQEKTSLKETDLLERVCELKLKQNEVATMGTCPGCGRPMSPKHHKCLYCGHTVPVQSAFQSL